MAKQASHPAAICRPLEARDKASFGRKRYFATTAVFLLSWLVYSAGFPFTGQDQAWVVASAVSLLHEGNTDLDEYVKPTPPVFQYALECVPPEGPAIRYRAGLEACTTGRVYNFFPQAMSVLALPFVWLMEQVTQRFGPAILAGFPKVPEPLRVFLSGDLIAGRDLAEMWIAAFAGACAVTIFYATARRLADPRTAWWLTLILTFGTSMWSLATRSLWQHGPSALFLTLAIYFLVRGRESEGWIAPAGMALAVAYTLRPTNSIGVLVLTLYVALHHRRVLWKFLAWASPVAVVFLTYNVWVRHSVLPLYYRSGLEWPGLKGWLLGLAEQTVSPSRGLIVFTPVFLVSFAGMVLAWRRKWLFPLAPYLIAITVLHAIVVAMWWPGYCYGSRYFADLNPLLALFLIPAVQAWEQMQTLPRKVWLGVFVTLAMWGGFVHFRGAYSVPAQLWNESPVSLIEQRDRVWDWRDPQFLRGL